MTCNAHIAERGQFWSRLSYGQIISNDGVTLTIENEKGTRWGIGKDIFADEFILAKQATSQKETTRTKLIEEIMRHPRIAMTIWFRKKVKDTDAVKAIRFALNYGMDHKSREFSTKVKEILAGELREMQGRHETNYDEHGRLYFLDVESKGLRTVDPRTIEKAIIDGVEYTVK